ncbi:hypothetical protein U1769_10465 [Sphingomonas sp. ZT3P38]|uniref:hypothetical protein n=1 Tax=Parasphingomonas zepuensis TaxID=3096161 RepID=UPI002FC817D9
MGHDHTDEERALETKLEWHRPSAISLPIEEITLGKLGSEFDGPGQMDFSS